MRLVGVPEAVIDFMVKFKGLGTTAPTRSTQQPSDSAGTSSSERLTVDLIVRLAQEHKRSVRGFAAALSPVFKTGQAFVLPAFYELLLWLRREGRLATTRVVLRTFGTDMLQEGA